MSDDELDAREALLKQHRNEKKELQAQRQALKKSVGTSDKKKKKEVLESIAKLEDELNTRHKTELEEFDKTASDDNRLDNLTNGVEANLKLDVDKDDHETNAVEDDDDAPLGPMRIKQESQKVSKAQKKRDAKAAKEKARLLEIEQQEEENKFGARAKEKDMIASKLKGKQLKLKEIPSNGDCLFAGLVDQLSQLNIESSVSQLRDQTATELESRPDEYSPFLTNPSTGDMYTEEEYKHYCQKMRSSPVWGGQIELKALSTILKRPIKVIQGEGPDILIGEDMHSDPLLLTYHRHLHGLGEHYNSVTSII